MLETKILFVDDDANILAAYQRSLRRRFEVFTSLSGEEGLGRIAKEGPFAVVVADMQMPGMNGIRFLRKVQECAPDSVRLMLTGNADQQTAVDAVNQGHVFSFLTKPCPPEILDLAVVNAVRQYRLVMAEKELLEQTLNGAIKVLTEVLAINDPQSFGRAQRLRDEVKVVASWFKAPRPWELELGAMLSQIGYVAIPGKLIEKFRTGAHLTGAERDMIHRVPETGAELLANIPRMGSVADIVRYQRKNFDGTGFPNDSGTGEEIPIGARIIRVLTDLINAEERETRVEAFQRMRQTSGVYDPKVLEAVAACFDVYLGFAADPSTSAQISFAELMVGQILAEDVQTLDGTLLVTAETHVTQPLLHRLRNFAELSGIREPIVVRK